MKRKLLIYLLLFWFASNANAQKQVNTDSLQRLLNKSIPDTSKISILNVLAEEHLYIDQEKMHAYALSALELSKETANMKGIAVAYNNLGIYHRVKGRYDEAIDFHFKSLDMMEELEDIDGIARCYNLIGIIYYSLEHWDLSLEYYLLALDINYKHDDKKWIAGNCNNIGMIYEQQKEYEKAYEYYHKSLEINIELGNKNWIANNYGNIGSLYQKTGNPQSLEYFQKRLKINEEQKDSMGIASSNHLIGNYFFNEGLTAKSISYLINSHELAESIRALSIQASASEILSKAFNKLEDYKSALYYEKLNKLYSGRLKHATNTEKITRLEMKYSYDKEQQIEAHDFERSKLVQTLLAFVLLSILIFSIYIYNKLRHKARKQKLAQSSMKLGNHLLEEELAFKGKMLQDNISYLLEINELFTAIISKFDKIQVQSKAENKQIIREIIGSIQTGMNDDVWEEFDIRFNQIHKEFYQKLNELFPDLSVNDKKLCAYLKLKMTSREIAILTSMSIKSIETARSRLRKRLNIKNKSQTLSEFFENI